ncbi:hypothetical protein P170DRAFT_479200 [Aspergillus steynii IBT 23096]|uniref:F-box domain-containing protein n=1 Tax=Aspergillus steynii IBT 23096 TaxID=1392250 RepID=A0A2I2G0C6_9EURO|nr:uncharacterized protein P170DRAFT_479200 [Aspergillus steynii IBT 23096]PLB46286.1 hypothetical protein P170DRAFT_479200 [Aspergillus steynii IBT 23096]
MPVPRFSRFFNRPDKLFAACPPNPNTSDSTHTQYTLQIPPAMGDSPFCILPIELFDHIISLLPIADRKSLRLTCRSLNPLSTPWVYRDLYIPMTNFMSQQQKFEEGFPQLVTKYGHFVRTLVVDGTEGRHIPQWTCPFRIIPYLNFLPNLQDTSIWGRCAMNEPFHHHHSDLFLRASLLTPPQHRIFRHLRSVELSIAYVKVGGTGQFFMIIPSVEKLILHGLRLDTFNFSDLGQFHGQTNLKSLTLNWPFINLESLKAMLAFPKALTYLEIQCCSHLFWCCNPAWTPKRLLDALSAQRESLEVLKLRETEKVMEVKLLASAFCSRPPDPSTPEYQFDLSAFPRLRVYEGFIPDTSGRFPRRDRLDDETISS